MTRISNPVDRRLANADEFGLPQELAAGVTGTLEHTASGTMIHTRIRLTEDLILISNGDAAAKAEGARLFQPGAALKMRVLSARINYALVLTAANMTTTAGEIGLGTAPASGAAADIGGTATFENILQGGANGRGGAVLDNITAGAMIRGTTYDGGSGIPAPASGSANSIYINAATTFANADPANLVLKAGSEIDIWWIPLPL